MIDASYEAGCDGVKFQLFKINELFSPEAIAFKPELLDRIKWELDENLIPELSEYTKSKGLLFSCTPFYLEAVDVLSPYVDFFKIASYELLWKDLFVKCASTNLPLVFSIGMSNEDEVENVLDTLKSTNVNEIIILHCNSSYPTPIQDVNLSVLDTLRNKFSNYYDNKKLYFGWSDHTVNEDVMIAAVLKYNSKMLEFHIDLDGSGYEFKAGHCWLPSQIRQLRDKLDYFTLIDGNSKILPSNSESIERSWRADPGDGLRPLLETRKNLF
jgi:N-acetylneuraminate synthase